MREADVVCCATTSTTPVFDAAWLRPGTHVNGIGAFNLGMVELPPELFGRAARGRHRRSGGRTWRRRATWWPAIEGGFVAVDDLVEIGSIDRSWADTRDPDAITVFKSVGLAIQDVAATELIVDRLLPPLAEG